VLPIMEAYLANKDCFRDQEIRKKHIAYLPVDQQFNQYTSEFAKTFGPAMGMSPIRLDHLINGYATNWGKLGTATFDTAASFLNEIDEVQVASPETGRTTVANLTGMKSFLGTNPNGMAVSIQEVYEMNNAINGVKKAVKSGASKAEKQSIIDDNAELWESRHRIGAAIKRFSSLTKRINAIHESRKLNSDEKAKALRKQWDLITISARKALQKD